MVWTSLPGKAEMTSMFGNDGPVGKRYHRDRLVVAAADAVEACAVDAVIDESVLRPFVNSLPITTSAWKHDDDDDDDDDSSNIVGLIITSKMIRYYVWRHNIYNNYGHRLQGFYLGIHRVSWL